MIQKSSPLSDVFAAPKNVLVGAQVLYIRNEGEELTVKCHFNFVGIGKVFCKEPCDAANSLSWVLGTGTLGGPLNFQFTGSQTNSEVSVTFRRLSRADSGLYTCGLVGALVQSKQVRVVVHGESPSLASTVTRGYEGLIIFAALQCPADGITVNRLQLHQGIIMISKL